MVDLNESVYSLLKNVARTELEFPDTNAKFPVITLTEIVNQSNYEVDNEERISDNTYQIDVWDNGSNRKRCEEIALQVSDIMTQSGFTRILGRGFKDKASGLHRKMMYFQIKVIN